MDEMRDRMIKVISDTINLMARETADGAVSYNGDDICSRLADTLLAAGVILPKFRVGQEVWVIDDGEIFLPKREPFIVNCTVEKINISEEGVFYRATDNAMIGLFECVEHEFFATESEALAALEDKK